MKNLFKIVGETPVDKMIISCSSSKLDRIQFLTYNGVFDVVMVRLAVSRIISNTIYNSKYAP